MSRVDGTTPPREDHEGCGVLRDGGPEVFRYEDVPDPTCGRATCSSPWRRSASRRRHTEPPGRGPRPGPHVVGYQCAASCGGRCAGRRPVPGDRVVTVGTDGSHAELRATGGRSAGRSLTGSRPRTQPACPSLRHGRRLPVRVRVACRRARPPDPCRRQRGGIAAIQLAKRAGAACWPPRPARSGSHAGRLRSRPRHRLHGHRLRPGRP